MINRICTLLAIIIFVSFSQSGCKEPMPSRDSIDKTFVGRWEMDKAATKAAQMEILKKEGLLDSKQQREQFDMLFDSSYFDFELFDNLDFRCSQGNMLVKGGYTGHWKHDGEKFSLIQTHENNKPKKDRMNGERKDGKLHLTHRADGMDLPYIFIKN